MPRHSISHVDHEARESEAASREPVAAVAKALMVLRAFVDGQREWGVRELAVAMGLPPTTVHRLLSHLRMEGFVQYDALEKKYSVGFEFSRMAAAVNQRDGFRQAALPVMRELTNQTGESVWLALYDPDQHRVAYIAESESTQTSRYLAPLGQTRALADTACGLAILASLAPQAGEACLSGLTGNARAQADAAVTSARRKGYAMLRANEVGAAIMVAAAVLGRSGEPLGSIGIVVPTHRFGVGLEEHLGLIACAGAARLSSRLGARLLGGSSAGTWNDAIGLISELLRRQAPALTITAGPGGGGRNLERISSGEGVYALTTASSLHDARAGRAPFSKPCRNLRSVMHLSEMHLLVMVRKEIHLRELAQLRGLRVSPGEQGYSTRWVYQDLLRVLGNTKPRRRTAAGAELFMDYPEGKRQFEAGRLDALVWLSGLTNPLVEALQSFGSGELHAIDADILNRMLELNPGYRIGKIPQASLPDWLSHDMPTITVPTVLVCRADRPDEEVYRLARSIYENRETLGQLSSVYKRISLGFVIDGLIAPIHPGADRFFREIGGTPSFARHAV